MINQRARYMITFGKARRTGKKRKARNLILNLQINANPGQIMMEINSIAERKFNA